ncbi:MAG: hypothetical protein ABJC13_13765 [Acidobacteriota bacterium]
MNRSALWVPISLLAALAAHAEVLDIAVPSRVEWCADISAPRDSQLSADQQQAVMTSATAVLIRCARSRDVMHIGIPYVAPVEVVDEASREVRIRLCAAVPSREVETCDPLVRRSLEAERALVSLCPAGASSPCRGEIAAAFNDGPFRLEPATQAQVIWRFVSSRADRLTTEAVQETLTELPLDVDAAPHTESPGVDYPFVLVVAFLPKAPAEAASE